ncbi:hypothetical protein ACFLV7_03925 [Chloroflexota bacterium]
MITKIRFFTKMIIVLSLLITIFIPQSMAFAQPPAVDVYYGYGNIDLSWEQGQMNAGEAQYNESEVVPMYLRLKDVDNGVTYSFTITNDYYQAAPNACGFDFLATYNTTISSFASNPPGWTGFSWTGSTAYPANVGVGDLYHTNVSNVSISFTSIDPVGGDRSIVYTVTFTSNVDGDAEFWWGNHLAIPDTCDVPGTLGAGGLTGGSLQSIVAGVGTLGGSSAFQMSSGAINTALFYGIKWFDTDNDGIYDPDGTPPEYTLSGWTINVYECTSTDAETCGTTPVETTQSDLMGDYSHSVVGLDDGTYYYQICEVLHGQTPPANEIWTNTEPGTDPPCHPVQEVTVTSGNYSATFNFSFGNYLGPTAVTMGAFTATPEDRAIRVQWNTIMETDTDGFNLYRSNKADGRKKRLMDYFDAKNPGGISGAQYEFLDQRVRKGRTVYYWLEAVYTNGQIEMFGPAEAVIEKARQRWWKQPDNNSWRDWIRGRKN